MSMDTNEQHIQLETNGQLIHHMVVMVLGRVLRSTVLSV